jgi:hypothetical protein
LARAWLESKATGVKQFDSSLKKLKDGRKAGKQHEPLLDSCRSIAKFLSKQGKTISHETIQKRN